MTVPTDPVERAARIIAAFDAPVYGWDELTPKWRANYIRTARAVLDDLAANTPTPEEAA